ncbi:MAG: HAD family hydrolase [Dehalococcoidia bacterium]|nr:MAG: HAD family hydrolase [Dehalococcoidia bacterium]
MEARPPFDPSAIRAVAFDGFGTLFDFTMAHFRVEVSSLLLTQRIAVDHEAFFDTWTKAYAQADVWPREPAETGHMLDRMLAGPIPDWHSQWEIWRRQFAAALATHEVPGDAEAAADHFRARLSESPPYADALETVEGLHARGYALALLSNADEDFLQRALVRARLRFSVIQSSESLRAYKPHHAVFGALCGRLSLEPGEILYVGDSPMADVTGAHHAGLRTAWLRRTETPYPERAASPDLHLDALATLLEALPPRRSGG